MIEGEKWRAGPPHLNALLATFGLSNESTLDCVGVPATLLVQQR